MFIVVQGIHLENEMPFINIFLILYGNKEDVYIYTTGERTL
jgi:hypothetical protein